MNTATMLNTSRGLGRALHAIQAALHVVPEGVSETRALRNLHKTTTEVWRAWLDHADSIDELTATVTWALGEGVDEFEDLVWLMEDQLGALAMFEREVARATRECERGTAPIDREPLDQLFQMVLESDQLRVRLEREVIGAYGSFASVAEVW